MDMTITTHSRTRRVAAAAGAIALGALGIVGLVGPASAAPIGEVGNIDPARDGNSSLVITKYEKSTSNGTTAGDGTPQTVTGATIDGVTFSLREVVTTPGNASLDLLTNAGWTQAAAVEAAWLPTAPTTLPAGYALGAAVTETTAGGGIAGFDGLGFGLYLVQETTPLAEGIIDPAQPFLVTLPFPTGTLAGNSAEWLYDVNVYPKNAVTELEKEVKTTDASYFTQASHVTWTVTSEVPQLPSGDTFTQYRLVDTIDPTDLAFLATSATPPAGVSGFGVRVYAAGGTTPLAGLTTAMYTINETAAATGTLELAFTGAGRTFLQANAQGGRVEFDVPTEVLAASIDTVVNDVTSFVNGSELDADAEQDFGQLRVFKYATTSGTAPTTTETPLTGATFQLYSDTDNDDIADAGERVTIDGATEWTVTNASGILDISGIKPGEYLLVESAAPVGYRTPAAGQLGSTTLPHEVVVVAGAVDEGAGINYIDVENYQMSPWELPFTGGNGVITFTVAGAGLMALALGFGLVALRRRKQAEQA